MQDSFADPKRVTKSYIPAVNAPIRIDVQQGHNQVATVSRALLKRGRPIGSKDKNPQKLKKGAENESEAKETLTWPRSLRYQTMRLGTLSFRVLKVLIIMRSQ